MWLPPSQTQAKVKGSRNQKGARLATSICCHSYQDFLPSVLVICQRKEILKAISILTSLVLPWATLQTSAHALLYGKKKKESRRKKTKITIILAWVVSRWRRLPSMTNNPIIKKQQRQIFWKVDASTYLSVSAGLVCHLQGWLSSLWVFFFNLSTLWLCSCTVQVSDCGPVIALTKERPDNEPVNGELQLKESQWLSMLGIGLNDIKEWTRHWAHGGQAFRKEVLFALYQSAVSQEEKQFKLTLKKGILPYCPLTASL